MFAIGIVADRPMLRAGLERIISEAVDLSVAASVESVADLDAQTKGYDAVMLDLHTQLRVPAVAIVGVLALHSPVVVTSTWERPSALATAVRAGARGFVAQHCAAGVIVTALTAVAQGGYYICADLATQFREEFVHNENTDDLAPREVETLRWIAHGLTHAQVAKRMGLTEHTVNTYVKRLRVKLNAGNKAQLTRKAIELGHVSGDDGQSHAA